MSVCVCVVLPSALETVGGEVGGGVETFYKSKNNLQVQLKILCFKFINELKMPVKCEPVSIH